VKFEFWDFSGPQMAKGGHYPISFGKCPAKLLNRIFFHTNYTSFDTYLQDS
jgi:hypothetical protein